MFISVSFTGRQYKDLTMKESGGGELASSVPLGLLVVLKGIIGYLDYLLAAMIFECF